MCPGYRKSETSRPLVTVILLNYKGAADTIQCLASLQPELREVAGRVVVIDNGSGDGSPQLIRHAHPWSEVVESSGNLGFTGGNNLGIRLAARCGAELIFLLNNDTVIESGLLSRMIIAMRENPTFGIISPRIDYYDRPGEPWFAGSKIELARGQAVHDNTNPPTGSAIVELPWLSGCAMFCRREVLEQTGGFDDRYFLNWEDVDLSLRAKKFGWKLGLVPSAVIRHKVSRSISKVSTVGTYYWNRNRLLSCKDHGGSVMRAMLDNLRRALRNVVRGESNSLAGLWATLRGCFDYLLGRFGRRTV